MKWVDDCFAELDHRKRVSEEAPTVWKQLCAAFQDAVVAYNARRVDYGLPAFTVTPMGADVIEIKEERHPRTSQRDTVRAVKVTRHIERREISATYSSKRKTTKFPFAIVGGGVPGIEEVAGQILKPILFPELCRE